MGIQFHTAQFRKIADLKRATYNPRKISDWEMRKLMGSIEMSGFLDPIVINADGTIIGGHQRVEALLNIGEESVPCIVLNISKEEERELNLRLNRTGGEWDEEMLCVILKDMDEGSRMRSGFDENEIALKVGEELKKMEENGEDIPSEASVDKCERCGRKMPKSKGNIEK